MPVATSVTLPYSNKNKITLCWYFFMVSPWHIRITESQTVMAIRRLAWTLLTTCVLAFMAMMPAFAMDLTIAPSPKALGATPKSSTAARKHGPLDSGASNGKGRQAEGKSAQKRGELISGEKGRRREKLRYRKIMTYSLLNNPAFKRVNAIDGARPGLGGASRVNGLGNGVATSQPSLPPNTMLNVASSVMSKPSAESAGIAFDCREKSSPTLREVTACYVHKVDKAWKAQTYVTKGLADTNPGWGGGLSVGYAY